MTVRFLIKHKAVCLVFYTRYIQHLIRNSFITKVTCLQRAFSNSAANKQKSPVSVCLCFALVWFQKFCNNAVWTIKQHKRNVQRATCKSQPTWASKVSVVWFSHNFLSDLQFLNISWRDINVAMQKTEGKKLSGRTKAPAHRNRTQVLGLEFFIRTKLYLWINKTGTKTLTSNRAITCIYMPKYFIDSESPELSVDDRPLRHFLADLFEQTGRGTNSPLKKIRNKWTQRQEINHPRRSQVQEYAWPHGILCIFGKQKLPLGSEVLQQGPEDLCEVLSSTLQVLWTFCDLQQQLCLVYVHKMSLRPHGLG